jgi:hypothetical protein
VLIRIGETLKSTIRQAFEHFLADRLLTMRETSRKRRVQKRQRVRA